MSLIVDRLKDNDNVIVIYNNTTGHIQEIYDINDIRKYCKPEKIEDFFSEEEIENFYSEFDLEENL